MLHNQLALRRVAITKIVLEYRFQRLGKHAKVVLTTEVKDPVDNA